jgi:midasin
MTIETVSQDPSSFIAALESTTNAHLRSALQTHLSSRLLDLLVATRDSTLDLNAGGRAWIGSAFTLLALYVPDVPIDPAVAQQAELALLQDREVRLNADFAAHQRSELELTGNSSNPKLKEISKDLLQVQRSISSLGPLVVERETNVALLNTMFQEVHHFLGQVVDPVRVQDLVDRLSSSPDSQAFLREQSAQDNIVGFIQRIDQTYDLFSDLSRPLHLALSQLRTGLRFLSRHAQLQAALEANRSEADLVSVLATFPTSLSTHRLHATNLPVRLKSETPAVATSNLLLLEALAIGYDASLGLPLDGRTVNSVGVVFDQLAHLWLMDREKEAQAKQEAESLYRQRKADEEVLSDLELEEREFKELFPQFGDIMDEDEEEDTSRDLADAASKKAKSFIQPDQAQQLYKLHGKSFVCLLEVLLLQRTILMSHPSYHLQPLSSPHLKGQRSIRPTTSPNETSSSETSFPDPPLTL